MPWLIERAVDQKFIEPGSASPLSLVLGLLGFGLMMCGFGAWTAMGIAFINWIAPQWQPSRIVELMTAQAIYMPPFAALVLVGTAVFLWHAPIPVRFVVAALMVATVGYSFLAPMGYFFSSSLWDTVNEPLFSTLFAVLAGTAMAAFAVQTWSHWRLTPYRYHQEGLSAPSIRTMLELCGVSAILFAIGFAVAKDSSFVTMESLLFLALIGSFGILGALAAIGSCFVRLRSDSPRWRTALVTCALFVATGSIAPGCVLAVKATSDGATGWDFASFILGSIEGTLLIGAIAWLLLGWLRACGWMLVTRSRS